MNGSWIGALLSVSLAAAAPAAALPGGASPVGCKENVEVADASIHLSDLLPQDAPVGLRTRASGIALGRAPEPGSLRVLQGAKVAEELSSEPDVLRRISLPAHIIVRRTGWRLSSETLRAVVSDFLTSRGLDGAGLAAAPRLAWPGDLATAQEHPDLQVTGARWDSGHKYLQIRVRCVQRDDCGSFLVQAKVPWEFAAEMGDDIRPSSRFHAEGKSPGATAPPVRERALAQPGDPATLVMDSGGIRISLPVICLQAGGLRQEIRARGVNNSHVFRAEVLGKGKLRALF